MSYVCQRNQEAKLELCSKNKAATGKQQWFCFCLSNTQLSSAGDTGRAAGHTQVVVLDDFFVFWGIFAIEQKLSYFPPPQPTIHISALSLPCSKALTKSLFLVLYFETMLNHSCPPGNKMHGENTEARNCSSFFLFKLTSGQDVKAFRTLIGPRLRSNV